MPLPPDPLSDQARDPNAPPLIQSGGVGLLPGSKILAVPRLRIGITEWQVPDRGEWEVQDSFGGLGQGNQL